MFFVVFLMMNKWWWISIYRNGNRIPDVWLNPLTKRLNLCSTLNNSVNHCFRNDKVLQKRRYTHVRLAQHKDRNGRVVYSISINDVIKHVSYNEIPTTKTSFLGKKIWKDLTLTFSQRRELESTPLIFSGFFLDPVGRFR